VRWVEEIGIGLTNKLQKERNKLWLEILKKISTYTAGFQTSV
jgi:hypothetical protein